MKFIMDVNSRLKELVRIKCDGNITEFSNVVGIRNNVTINQLVNGKGTPSFKTITKILKVFSDVNPVWIILGEGQMFILILISERLIMRICR